MGRISIKLFKTPVLFPLCSGEYRKSQLLFIFDGIFINAATVLTTGVFLSGYIVYLNGSDFLVGILNNSATWASVVAVFSYLIYERMKKRKTLLVVLNIISRFLVCAIIFLPLVCKNNNLALTALTVMVISGNVIWSFYSIGITVMMISMLSKESRNQYIYVRMFWLRISFTIATISMGFILDLFNRSYTGFLIVFVTSLVLSIADAIVIMNIKEPEYVMEKTVKFNPSTFFEPMINRKFRSFLIFVFFLYLSLTISSSFTNLYLIRYMKFDYSFISMINVISYILMIVCTKVWGRVEKNKSLNFVMSITPLFMIGEYVVYSFLTSRTYFLLYFAPIISGIGNSGFNIALVTHRYELMPENSQTIYEGWFGAVYGLSMLISPVIGSSIMGRLPVLHNSVYQYSSFQLLYLISSILAIGVVYMMFFYPKNSDTIKNKFGLKSKSVDL
jgi:Major Facilitator Superfamily.